MDKGIIVGSDRKQEWLIPWWWKYYTLYNSYPVTFIDFGMSPKALSWCRKRGEVITPEVPQNFFASKDKISPHLVEAWEGRFGKKVWKVRQEWFKKPFACLKAPYEISLWLDLDCEVCAPLSALFEAWDASTELGIVPSKASFPWQPFIYGSGVIIFKKNASFLQKWADLCLKDNNQFLGDENALTELIFSEPLSVHELPEIYNWVVSAQGGFHMSPVITHWGGKGGKLFLKKFGGHHDHVKL
jgi:hypothetical protein